MLFTDRPEARPGLVTILENMNRGQVLIICRTDRLLVLYGSNLVRHYMRDGDQKHNISSQLRRIASVLLEIRRVNTSVSTMQPAINPKLVREIVRATENYCGWNDETAKVATKTKQTCTIHTCSVRSFMQKSRKISIITYI